MYLGANIRGKRSVKKMRGSYPLTLVSSTAKVFMATCIRSKLVLFHTKSTVKLWFISTGTPCNNQTEKSQIHKQTSIQIINKQYKVVSKDTAITSALMKNYTDSQITAKASYVECSSSIEQKKALGWQLQGNDSRLKEIPTICWLQQHSDNSAAFINSPITQVT